ncbi:hypothetical protein ACJ5H2_00480 [Nocardioides sp. R1-1]|uniref:hypothetical protein n=1 Tax=Nocardioides sp. R1-1 TaxID=3383502 RepID=UPI0038CF31D2
MRSPEPARAVDLPRSFVAWMLAHGIQRSLIQRGARKGDLISRMVMDPALRVDPFPAYEELRARGPVSANDLISASVDHAVCNEVLRSDASVRRAARASCPGRCAGCTTG